MHNGFRFQENCKARVETFGLTGELSEEEYQEIYQTTGIDVDDRQAFISSLSKVMVIGNIVVR